MPQSKDSEETMRKANQIIHTEDFLKGIFDSSPLVSIVVSDCDRNVLFGNKRAENIFG